MSYSSRVNNYFHIKANLSKRYEEELIVGHVQPNDLRLFTATPGYPVTICLQIKKNILRNHYYIWRNKSVTDLMVAQ